ncbi:glutamyl aminopeptidase [Carcharodon carcharias]|uniref:glutamyl aminopeptidase n=1 Tax=Carcharodon carcharias TaxID=13397 RepID=UPI001B7DE8A9|nr:glutamyl aminopeptidase [Carcharodon carcharias]
MDCEERPRRKRCMSGKNAAIILAAVVVAVGLAVGLGVGLSSRTEVCEAGGGATTASPGSPAPSTPAPGPCPPNGISQGPWNNFRLPDYINPIHYDLELKPDMDGELYTGKNIIHILTSKPTKYLWLHIKATRVTAQPVLQHAVTPSDLRPLQLRRCFEYKFQEYLVLEAVEELAANQSYRLTLEFEGSLLGSLIGFYKTTYVENGVVKSIAATDHEPTDARKSFPCFDEPNKKATYTISLIYNEPYQVLSNMPVEKVVPLDGGLKKATFQKSVPMSTYLVCFAVHQFTFEERYSSRGIPLRIYVQPEQKHTAKYAADTMKNVFDYFEKYFNIHYSLPKLDMIAIPDFGTGAMENWGLVTFRETNLLFDQNESSSYNQQRVASVIAHELVHQWFGNLVTMDWWDDLWLNEGFASFFEYIGVNATEFDWLMLDQILIDDVLSVMADDALLSSHPIIVNVSTPSEITSVFDGISYSKGASILRMLRDWITPEEFQQGCQKYLMDHRFANAKTDDFWQALTEVSGKPVKEVMDTWTQQMGFPVLNVESMKILTQKRFLLDSDVNATQPPSPLNYRWNIPIKWHTLNGKNETIFNSSSTSITLNYRIADGLLKINTDHVGFYRVQYEATTWDQIIAELIENHTLFSVADRTGLIDDAFSLGRATLLNYSVALNITRYLKNETEYLPWSKAISSSSYIRNMLEDDKILYLKFQTYWKKQIKPITDKLGWKDEGPHLDRLLREDALGLACRMGDAEALVKASNLFEEWMKGKTVSPNLRQIVYRYGMQSSGKTPAWEFMLKKYQETPLAQEKDKLLYGLASVENVWLLDRFLKYIKNESLIKSQDVFTVLRYISYNKYGKTMAWDWMRLNWEYLVERYTINDRNLGRLVSRITRSFNTELSLWQMKDFFAKYPKAGAGETPRKQALETVQTNIEWLKRNKAEIEQWLQSNA